LDTASGCTFPARICDSAIEVGDMKKLTFPPSTAVIAGPPPLVGRCRICRSPADLANNAVGICDAPERPDQREISLSGLALASATRSLSVLYGKFLLTIITIGSAMMRAIAMKSAFVNFGCRPNSLSTAAKPEIETIWESRV